MSNEGIDDMETKPNATKEAINNPIATNKIEAVNEKDKPQASKSKKYKPISNR